MPHSWGDWTRCNSQVIVNQARGERLIKGGRLLDRRRLFDSGRLRSFSVCPFCLFRLQYQVSLFQLMLWIATLVQAKIPLMTATPRWRTHRAPRGHGIALQACCCALLARSQKQSTTRDVGWQAMTVTSEVKTCPSVLLLNQAGPIALLITVVLETSAMEDQQVAAVDRWDAPVLCLECACCSQSGLLFSCIESRPSRPRAKLTQ